jgi:hypothetical protein
MNEDLEGIWNDHFEPIELLSQNLPEGTEKYCEEFLLG